MKRFKDHIKESRYSGTKPGKKGEQWDNVSSDVKKQFLTKKYGKLYSRNDKTLLKDYGKMRNKLESDKVIDSKGTLLISIEESVNECHLPSGELNGLLVSIPDRIRALKQSREAYSQQGWDVSSYDLEIQQLENKLAELKTQAGLSPTQYTPGSRVISTGGANEI